MSKRKRRLCFGGGRASKAGSASFISCLALRKERRLLRSRLSILPLALLPRRSTVITTHLPPSTCTSPKSRRQGLSWKPRRNLTRKLGQRRIARYKKLRKLFGALERGLIKFEPTATTACPDALPGHLIVVPGCNAHRGSRRYINK